MKFRQVEDKDRVRTHKTQPGGRLQGSWRRSERHAVLGNDDHLDNNNDNDNGDNNYSSSRSGWSCSSCRRWVLTTPCCACSSERMILNMGGVQNKQKIDFSETKKTNVFFLRRRHRSTSWWFCDHLGGGRSNNNNNNNYNSCCWW